MLEEEEEEEEIIDVDLMEVHDDSSLDVDDSDSDEDFQPRPKRPKILNFENKAREKEPFWGGEMNPKNTPPQKRPQPPSPAQPQKRPQPLPSQAQPQTQPQPPSQAQPQQNTAIPKHWMPICLKTAHGGFLRTNDGDDARVGGGALLLSDATTFYLECFREKERPTEHMVLPSGRRMPAFLAQNKEEKEKRNALEAERLFSERRPNGRDDEGEDAEQAELDDVECKLHASRTAQVQVVKSKLLVVSGSSSGGVLNDPASRFFLVPTKDQGSFFFRTPQSTFVSCRPQNAKYAISSGASKPRGWEKLELVNPDNGKRATLPARVLGAIGTKPVPTRESAVTLAEAQKWAEEPGAVILAASGDEDGIAKQDRPIVLDPEVAKHMRPHQITGLRFLFKCVMGVNRTTETEEPWHGCILADEMGLGKTLTTISFIWTAMLQSSQASGSCPIAQRTLILLPVSLIDNWNREFKKWTPPNRLQVLTCKSGDHSSIRKFRFGHKGLPTVLIMGYESFRVQAEANIFKNCRVDLLVCDEAHRLKNSNTKTTQAVASVKTSSRILLSGTPVQNKMSEFYAMLSVALPGLLKGIKNFKAEFDRPIIKGSEPDATEAEREKAHACLKKLSQRARPFILQRSNTLLQRHLPPKHEHICFLKPTELQHRLYDKVIDSVVIGGQKEANPGTDTLSRLNSLRLVLNHPKLSDRKDLCTTQDLQEMSSISCSAKFEFVVGMVEACQITHEKCVIVSIFTKTLDLLQTVLTARFDDRSLCRLDGTTAQFKRQGLVDKFNSSAASNQLKILLLSSKAGGVGLNLVGASRLILMEPDWNPANDRQALSRIWRDGQKKDVHVHRLITAGTLEEIIHQRQATKETLSASVMEPSISNTTKIWKMANDPDLLRRVSMEPCLTHTKLRDAGTTDIYHHIHPRDLQQPGQHSVDPLLMEPKVFRQLTFIFVNATDPLADDGDDSNCQLNPFQAPLCPPREVKKRKQKRSLGSGSKWWFNKGKRNKPFWIFKKKGYQRRRS